MKKKVITRQTPETPIKDAAHLMKDKKIGCVPVVREGGARGSSDHHRYP